MRILFLLVLLAVPARAQLSFSDQTAQAGIDFVHVGGSKDKGFILEAHGSGAVFFDADGDGDLDLYMVNGSNFTAYEQGPGNVYYRNEGGHFVDETARAGLGDRRWGAGVAVGDVDGDGLRDLYLTNYGANALFRNRYSGEFAEFAEVASGAEGGDFSASAAFVDYDQDGDLDLYVSNYVAFDIQPLLEDPSLWDPCVYLGGLRVFCGPVGLPGGEDRLYRNDGNGQFVDVTDASGIAAANDHYGLGVVPEDFDADGDMDLFVANDERANVLWRNDGGAFVDVAIQAGVAFNIDGEEESGMGVDVGDYDGDGDGDIFVTNFYGETNTLYRNDGQLQFVDATSSSGLAAPSVEYLGWGAHFFDADSDGDLDLFSVNSHVYPQVDQASTGGGYAQRNQLFRNDGGSYVEVDGGPGLAIKAVSRGTASGDYDGDGDVDLLVTNLDEAPTLLRNDTATSNGHIAVDLLGKGLNRHGVGAQVGVRVNGQTLLRTVNSGSGYLGANGLRLHFGLGESARAEWVSVRWPGGARDTVYAVAAGSVLRLSEGGEN